MSHSDEISWQVYENSVQQYRVLSVTTQGLLLTAGAILFGMATPTPGLVDLIPFLAVTTAAMAATWLVFYPVITARAAITDFHKYSLGGDFDEDGRPRTADDGARPLDARRYASVSASGKALRAEVEAAGGPHLRRPTRLKLDVILPGIVTAVWVVLVVVAVATVSW